MVGRSKMGCQKCLGAFTQLKEVIISFFMSVPLSVCPHGASWLPLFSFPWNLVLNIFRNSVEKYQVSLKQGKNML
jgi:hypothetical protein